MQQRGRHGRSRTIVVVVVVSSRRDASLAAASRRDAPLAAASRRDASLAGAHDGSVAVARVVIERINVGAAGTSEDDFRRRRLRVDRERRQCAHRFVAFRARETRVGIGVAERLERRKQSRHLGPVVACHQGAQCRERRPLCPGLGARAVHERVEARKVTERRHVRQRRSAVPELAERRPAEQPYREASARRTARAQKTRP